MSASVHVEVDGTWVLYFYAWGNQFSSGPESWSIGRATAPGPTGPWTVDDKPVLLPGPEGAWDAAQVSSPSVLPVDDGYVMYYDGSDNQGQRLIGMATSEDGLNWIEYDDPVTDDALYVESDPVFVSGEEGTWDATMVHQPSVVITSDGWVMSYRSASPSGADKGYGFANSQDGLTWTRYSGNPLLFNKDVARRGLGFHELIHQNGVYYLLFEMQRGYQNETDIYFATVEGNPFE